jgi:acetolactate synthase-1/2/3 large subunit
MELNGAEIIMGILEREGIEVVAGIPAARTSRCITALARRKVRHVLARHEQAAGFMAQGMARTTGKVAVCFATSGPGVTNLLTAIATPSSTRSPSSRSRDKCRAACSVYRRLPGDRHLRPLYSHRQTQRVVKSAAELLVELPRAFAIARSGRPGPVIIDVPKDVQTERFNFDIWPEAGASFKTDAPDPRRSRRSLRPSRKPNGR